MTQQLCQLWPSTSVCLCPLLPLSPPHPTPSRPLWLLWAQAFVGVWPLRTEKKKKKKEEGIIDGEHRFGRRACMCVQWECWLASADATQASAVSSHQLIPLPRSPCDPEVLGSLLWPGTFSMDGEVWTEAPVCLLASATSSLWHNRDTHTHTSLYWGAALMWAHAFLETMEQPILLHSLAKCDAGADLLMEACKCIREELQPGRRNILIDMWAHSHTLRSLQTWCTHDEHYVIYFLKAL